AALLEDAAQLRLEIGESLGDAVANRTGLAGKAATDDGGNDVVLVDAISGNDRLLQDHLKNRTCQILCAFLAGHGDLARTRLDPDTSNRVLALAGCVGTALSVELLDVYGSRGFSGLRCSAEFLERIQFSHRPTPSHSSCCEPQLPASLAAGLRADGQHRHTRAGSSSGGVQAARAGSCARLPSRPRALGNDPRGCRAQCAP